MSLFPNGIYHIYNHAIGDDNLFRTEENYTYFLKRYAYFIHPIARTYSYCLMPNHFHLLVKIRSEEELFAVFSKFQTSIDPDLEGFQNLQGLTIERKISKQFSNLFNSYTKSYNKYFNRRGALFCHNFKRKHIDKDNYFSSVIQYIHRNPVHHGFCSEIKDWKWTSYHALLCDKTTLLERQEILDWFGTQIHFREAHQCIPENYAELAADDFY